jgi:hypothetical protein
MKISIFSGSLSAAIADQKNKEELVSTPRITFFKATHIEGQVSLLVFLQASCKQADAVLAAKKLAPSTAGHRADYLISISTLLVLLVLIGLVAAFGNAFYDSIKSFELNRELGLATVLFLILFILGMFSRPAVAGDMEDVSSAISRWIHLRFTPLQGKDLIAKLYSPIVSSSPTKPSGISIVCGYASSPQTEDYWNILDGLLAAARASDINVSLYVPKVAVRRHAEHCDATIEKPVRQSAEKSIWDSWPLVSLLSSEQQLLLRCIQQMAIRPRKNGSFDYGSSVSLLEPTDEWMISRSAVIAVVHRLQPSGGGNSEGLANAFDSLISDFCLMTAAKQNDLYHVSDVDAWSMIQSEVSHACPSALLHHHIQEWQLAIVRDSQSTPFACATAFAFEIAENYANTSTSFARTPTTRLLFSRIVEAAYSAEAYASFAVFWPALRGNPLPELTQENAFEPLRGMSTDTLKNLALLLESSQCYQDAEFIYTYLSNAMPILASIRLARLMERCGEPRKALNSLVTILNPSNADNLASGQQLRLDALLQSAWCIVSGFLEDKQEEGEKYLAEARQLASALPEGSLPPIQLWRMTNYEAQYREWENNYPAALALHRKALDTPGLGLKEVSGTLVNLGLTWRKEAIAKHFSNPGDVGAIGNAIAYAQKGLGLKEQIGDLDELHVACHNLALTKIWQALMLDDPEARSQAVLDARRQVEAGLSMALGRGNMKKLDSLILEGEICTRLDGAHLPALNSPEVLSFITETKLDLSIGTSLIMLRLATPMHLPITWMDRIDLIASNTAAKA